TVSSRPSGVPAHGLPGGTTWDPTPEPRRKATCPPGVAPDALTLSGPGHEPVIVSSRRPGPGAGPASTTTALSMPLGGNEMTLAMSMAPSALKSAATERLGE